MGALFLSLVLVAGHCVEDPRYHTTEEVFTYLDSVAQNFPEITRLETLAYTQRFHQPVLLLTLTDHPQDTEPEPTLLLTGSIHAEELLGTEVLMALLDTLLRGYGHDPLITHAIDSLEIQVLPLWNVDGHDIVMSLQDTSWRKNLRDNDNDGELDLENRCDGVDLNRNFDYRWDYGNSNPCASYYRGPSPFSEPEARGVRDLCLRMSHVLAIHYHSPALSQGEIVYTPYHTAPEFPLFYDLAIQLAHHIPNDAGTGTYQALYGGEDPGKARNWQYDRLGTFAYDIEICSYRTQVPGWEVDTIVNHHLQGLFWLLDRILHGPSLWIRTVEQYTGNPQDQVRVRILEIDYPPAPGRIPREGTGFVYRFLSPGTYTVEVTPLYASGAAQTLQVTVGTQPTFLTVEVPPLLDQPLVWPTVTRDQVEVVWTQRNEGATLHLHLVNPQGQRVWGLDMPLRSGAYHWTVPLDNLPQGVYLLHFRIPSCCTGIFTPEIQATYKIVKLGG